MTQEARFEGVRAGPLERRSDRGGGDAPTHPLTALLYSGFGASPFGRSWACALEDSTGL